MSDYGKQVVTIVELDVPECQLEYGTTNAAGTCTAQLGPDGETQGSPPVANTGNRKCYNTRSSCQDPDNYLPATQVIRFSHPQRGLTKHYDNVFPMLVAEPGNPAVTPGAVNLGGMDRSLSALGAREVVDVTFEDARWNDHLFDKYRLERISGDASLEQEGTAQAGSANSLTLAADAPDVPVGRLLKLVSGAGSEQSSRVKLWDGSTKVATVSPRWRTNIVQRSEEFDNAYWSKSGVTVSADAAADPDGDVTADEVIEDTGSAQHRLTRSVTLVNGQTYVLSARVRRGAGSRHAQLGATGTAAFIRVYFDLTTGQVGTQTAGTGAIEDLGGGWYRISAVGVCDTDGANLVFLANANATTFGSETYTGDGASSIYWSGAQLENASALGDYTKTVAAAITLPDATTGYEVRDAFDPYERGTFWGKFLARNPFYANYRARVRRGFMGDALEDMNVRSYIVDRITGPKNGRVSLSMKDLFSLIEARKAVAPVASQGELFAGISISDTTATLSPAGIGDEEYPASGHVAIQSEAIFFTRSADVLTFLDGSPPASTRGSLNTEAEAHDAEDLVQLVLSFESELVQDIIYTLLTEYAEIPAANIDKDEWDILAAAAGMDDLYTARIVEPTPVKDLIGELCEQAGCTVWHDPATDMIRFQPLRPQGGVKTVTDREWIVDGSLDLKRQDNKRVSRTAVYFAQDNPTLRLDDRKNYRQRVITPDLAAESPTQYGVPAIKEIFSRWIPQFSSGLAGDVGARINALFRDPPHEASFRLFRDRDGQLQLAEPFNLLTFEGQDDTGAQTPILMSPVEIAREENEIAVKAQGVKFFTDPDEVAGVREITLNSTDMRNLNLRTIHDSIFSAPTGDEVITFILPSGFTVGSTSTGQPAIRTGSWPTMATAPRLTIDGEVDGAGGVAGAGGSLGGNGAAGGKGGTAMLAEVEFEIDNLNGIMRGGAGGGGGGGSGGPISGTTGGGGGGGGGAGVNPGNGGAGGDGNAPLFKHGSAGSAGTTTTGGAGGAGGSGGGVAPGGSGGTGGALGSNGSAGANGGGISPGSGGAGGSVGDYISGNSLVTWINDGTRIGGVA
jgi:hypothetical protein